LTLLSRLVLLVVAALLPTLPCRSTRSWVPAKARERQVHEEALRLAHILADQQRHVTEGARQLLSALGKAPSLMAGDPVGCRAYLDDVMREFPRYATVSAAGLDGRVSCTARPNGAGQEVGDRAWFREALATGGFVVGEYIIGRGSGRPSISFSQPYRDRDGQVAGVIVAALDLGWLSQELGAAPLPEGASIFILDRNGILLARRPAVEGLAGQQAPAPLRALLMREREGTEVLAEFDGVRRVIGYTPLGAQPAGLLIAVGLDAGRAFAGAERAGRLALLLIAAVVALALGLAVLGGRRLITRPVDRLLAAAGRWRAGDLSARIGHAPGRRGGSEFARLGAAFDDMAAALQERERRLAESEAASRERAAVRAAILEQLAEGVIIADAGGRITFVNAAAARLHGGVRIGVQPAAYSEAYRLFTEDGQPYPPADLPLARAVLHGEAAQDARWRIRRPDGTEVLAVGSARPVVGPDGARLGAVLTLRDETERVAAEARLSDSEAFLRSVLDASTDCVKVIERDGTLAFMNTNGQSLLEIEDFGALQGQEYAALWPEAGAAQVRHAVAEALAGRPTRFEAFAPTARGTPKWWDVAVAPVRDADGRIVRIVSASRDVTERRQAEEALAEAEERLRLATEGMGLGIWDMGVGTGEGVGTPNLFAIYGLPVPPDGRARMADFVALFHPADAEAVAREEARARVAGNRFRVEHRIRRADTGAERWVEVHGRYLATQGRSRFLGVLRDITPRKQAEAVLARDRAELEGLVDERTAALRESEARLAQAAKMEALGRLAGGVAHDFNNVLQAVQGGLTLAAKRLDRDVEDARRFMALAADATKRGAAVTSRLLAFARRGELQVSSVAPARLLDGVASLLRHTLGPSVTLRVDAAPDLPALLADAGQLEAVLVNLANNARDALTDGTGTIILGAMRVAAPPRHLPPGDYIRLFVSDDGEGMAPDVLARVTEPFFTTKPKGRGTGLGLAMARGFAEQSGGALLVESRRAEGTTVSLLLPQSDGAVAVPDIQAGPEAPQRVTAALLVVDDEPTVRATLGGALSDHGHLITEAESGAAALALVEAGIPLDALVTDLAMPGGMDGLMLLREARRRRPGLPGVLVTGHLGDAVEAALEEAAAGGPFAVLHKPCTVEAVEAQLAALLGRALARVA
jgi:PAS domain S-box-containing protein